MLLSFLFVSNAMWQFDIRRAAGRCICCPFLSCCQLNVLDSSKRTKQTSKEKVATSNVHSTFITLVTGRICCKTDNIFSKLSRTRMVPLEQQRRKIFYLPLFLLRKTFEISWPYSELRIFLLRSVLYNR